MLGMFMFRMCIMFRLNPFYVVLSLHMCMFRMCITSSSPS